MTDDNGLLAWSAKTKPATPLERKSVASLRYELKLYIDSGFGEHPYADKLRAELLRRRAM